MTNKQYCQSCILLVLYIILYYIIYIFFFSPSNKIHREVGRAKDLPAPLYMKCIKYSNVPYILYIYIYIYIYSPSNKIHREVGRAKDIPAPLYTKCIKYNKVPVFIISVPSNSLIRSFHEFWLFRLQTCSKKVGKHKHSY